MNVGDSVSLVTTGSESELEIGQKVGNVGTVIGTGEIGGESQDSCENIGEVGEAPGVLRRT